MSKDRTQMPQGELQNPFRTSYTEEDVAALLASPRFLVAVDAYGANYCSLAQMSKLAFSEPPYSPRDVDLQVFADLRGRGYDGGYDAVRRYARRWAKERGQSTAAAYVPPNFAPGEALPY